MEQQTDEDSNQRYYSAGGQVEAPPPRRGQGVKRNQLQTTEVLGCDREQSPPNHTSNVAFHGDDPTDNRINFTQGVSNEDLNFGNQHNAQNIQRCSPGLPPTGSSTKKKNSKKMPSSRAPAVKRGSGFSQSKTDSLLDLIEEYMPLGREEWEMVARLHTTRFPAQGRNADSLLRKFSAICRTTVPTGDPTIPRYVLRAKRVREQMTQRADIGDGVESDEEVAEVVKQGDMETYQKGVYEANELGTSRGESDSGNPSCKRQMRSPSPRPLVRKRLEGTQSRNDGGESILEIMKASIMQDRAWREAEYQRNMINREAEKQRREEERVYRAEGLEEDRKRREEEMLRSQEEGRRWEEERRDNNKMMQMVMMAFLGQRGHCDSNDTDDRAKGRYSS